ncbi:hypothetical protein [Streptomyces sp. ISL-11]|uniref:hypothetical protein n=1 Tax=Streptomyces sp. ISL-11 TaxID=2819174 RepID=UPI0035B18591
MKERVEAQVREHMRRGDWPTGKDPARDLDRLLDRFRDDVRDAARDHGVTPDQLASARRHLAEAAARIDAVLRPEPRPGE